MRAADLHRLSRKVREIAFRATGNTGDDRVSPGELAVLEDIARNPGASIGHITRRTGLAQSLVSRITRSLAAAGVVTISVDGSDRRKVRIVLEPAAQEQIMKRADNSITEAVAEYLPALSPEERAELVRHFRAAELLFRLNTQRTTSTKSVRAAGVRENGESV